jgi:hypothetical protein
MIFGGGGVKGLKISLSHPHFPLPSFFYAENYPDYRSFLGYW